MKNGNKKLAAVTLTVGILMVVIGIVGLNYKSIRRLIGNVGNEKQSFAVAFSGDKESLEAKSDDEKEINNLVDKYMKAYFANDASAILNMQPEEVINLMGTYISWMFEDQEEYFREMEEDMAYNWEELQESLDVAEYTITYEISDYIDMPKEEIADYQSGYSMYAILDDELDELNMEITEAKMVVIDLYVNSDDTNAKVGKLTPTFIKVDGEWYLGIDQ